MEFINSFKYKIAADLRRCIIYNKLEDDIIFKKNWIICNNIEEEGIIIIIKNRKNNKEILISTEMIIKFRNENSKVIKTSIVKDNDTLENCKLHSDINQMLYYLLKC